MNILLAIIVLGILVFIHELGHFLAAKLTGVYVEKFSIGFGPKLFGKKVGETEYCFSAFPLGGFVKMYGEREEDTPDPMKAGRAFNEKSAWKRSIIILAGPIANLILAAVVFSGLFMSGYPAYKAVVGSVTPDSPAAVAGLAEGDIIDKVDGKNMRSWNEFANIVSESTGKQLNITYNTDKTAVVVPQERSVTTIFGDKENIGDIGAELYVPPVIGGTQTGLPAAEAGLKKGDKIISVNGEPIKSWNMSAEYIRARPDEKLSVTVARGGENMTFELTPKLSEIQNAEGKMVNVGLIGITPTEGDIIMQHGFFESMGLGLEKSYEFTKIVLLGFVKLIQRAVPADSLGGPIMIVQLAADSAQSGFTALFTFMAIISVNLAIFNLLPIPVLDGGHLLMIAIEAVTRRKPSEKFVGAFQMFGFALLMCLMVFAFYNDLSRIFFK